MPSALTSWFSGATEAARYRVIFWGQSGPLAEVGFRRRAVGASPWFAADDLRTFAEAFEASRPE